MADVPLPRWTWLFGLGLVLNLVLWLSVAAPQALGFPYGLDFGEGILLNQARRLQVGEPLYPPITQSPYLVDNYPPLYPALVSPFVTDPPTPAAGRLFSILGTLAVVAMLGLHARTQGGGWLYLLPLAWLAAAPSWTWGLVMRVDLLGIAFVLAALLCMTRDSRMFRWVGLTLFALAFLTKHSLVAGALAWVIAGWGTDRREGLRRLLQITLALGVPWLAIDLASQHGLFLHTIRYTANEFHWHRLIAGMSEFATLTLPLWALFGLGMATSIGDESNEKALMWLAYLGLATLTLITFGATGSDSNYYLEPLLALLAAITVVWGRVDYAARCPWPLSHTAMAPYLLLAFALTGRWGQAENFQLIPDPPAMHAAGEQLVAELEGQPGPVLSEDFSFTLAAGKTPDFQPYIFRLLEARDKWDESPFLQSLTDQRYDRIYLRTNLFEPGNPEEEGQDTLGAGFDRLTPAMEQAIRSGYELIPGPAPFLNGPWYRYRPRPR